MTDNEDSESEYIEASEASEASEEVSEEVSDEASDEEIIHDSAIEDLSGIEPIIHEKKNENLSKLFDTFCKKIHKKKEKQEKKRKIKNYERFKQIVLKKEDDEEVYFKTLSPIQQQHIIEQLESIKPTQPDKPLRLKLLDLQLPQVSKVLVLNKIEEWKHMNKCGSEYNKLTHWIETLMTIPFNVSSQLPIQKSDGVEACRAYIQSCKNCLNEVVFGMNDAKLQFMQLIGQWINNPSSIGNSIALKGPMGTGKTTLLKHGISKLLNREIGFIALGGASDGSYLDGHSYTYEGSTYGKIIDVLIQCKTNNPIIYFDELDKVSESPKGEEIIGILTHLTDTTQNTQFIDKYFSEVPVDLSKCLFVFSYNDEDKVSKILRDRMYVIETRGYSTPDKVVISKQFLIPSIVRTLMMKDSDLVFEDDLLAYIIDSKTPDEKGVRNLKRSLEVIFSKLNLYSMMEPNTQLFQEPLMKDLKYPLLITRHMVDKLVPSNRVFSSALHMYL